MINHQKCEANNFFSASVGSVTSTHIIRQYVPDPHFIRPPNVEIKHPPETVLQ